MRILVPVAVTFLIGGSLVLLDRAGDGSVGRASHTIVIDNLDRPSRARQPADGVRSGRRGPGLHERVVPHGPMEGAHVGTPVDEHGAKPSRTRALIELTESSNQMDDLLRDQHFRAYAEVARDQAEFAALCENYERNQFDVDIETLKEEILFGTKSADEISEEMLNRILGGIDAQLEGELEILGEHRYGQLRKLIDGDSATLDIPRDTLKELNAPTREE